MGKQTPLGDWMSRQMTRRGMSQADLARKIPTSTGTVSNWFGGKRRPSTESCHRIADVFDVDPDVVLTLARHRPVPLDFNPDDAIHRLLHLAKVVDWTQTAGIQEGIIGMLEKLPRRAKGDTQ